MSQLSQREKVLATMVALVFGIILNLVLFNFFIRNQRRLQSELITKNADLQAKKILLAEKDLWEQRDAWLQAKMPKLTNESGVGVQLLDSVKEVAKKYTVLVENPALGTAEKRAHATVVSVTVETKSPWPEMVKFLRDLQTPEQFIVFERANIQKDPSDPTQMRGQLKIAKWFAPK
jgi:hypothetical protein